MVLPVDPIAVATLSFTVAAKAWITFKTALHFSDDANDLVLRLDIEYARFHLWSRNAGHEKEGDSFDLCLLPVIELINQILERLTTLFRDVGTLRSYYGLSDSGPEVDESKKMQRFLSNLSKALNATGMKVTSKSTPEDDESAALPTVRRTSTLNRARWGIRDKLRFQGLVETVETFVLKLSQLLNDSQQKKLAEDRARLNAIIVASIGDAATLQVVRNAARAGIQDAPIDNLCGRLALSGRIPSTETSLVANSQLLLPLAEFPCLNDVRGTPTARMLTRRTSVPDKLILLERKTYPSDTSRVEFNLLSDRVQRIVLLLRTQRADLQTLRCIGYIHDSLGKCWWMAFDYTTMIPATVSSPAPAPVSLRDLLADKSTIRPALESRIVLAGGLASSISSLFSSSWLHKSIRSENILFPQLTISDLDTRPGSLDTSSPYLTGFEYSRQTLERSLGKPWHKDINRAIYRHPFYQGEVPGSYCTHYDVYSFGLVLVEIARWMPLASFLDNKTTSSATANIPQLSTDMKDFTRVDAEELQKRVLYFVDREIAFRVGTLYCDAVRWCLTHADEKRTSKVQQVLNDGVIAVEEDWRPALDFYNNVVVPLDRLASGNDVKRFSGT